MYRDKNLHGHWTVREVLGPDSKNHRYYYYKRRNALRVGLSSPMAVQLAGYSLIEKDLRNVESWIRRMDELFPEIDRPSVSSISEDREIFNQIKALTVACVTFYGKCFTKCEGRRTKLDRSIIDDKCMETHDHVMRMRHGFAAHSGADGFEEVQIALVLPANKRAHEEAFIFTELSQADMWIDSQMEVSFRDLVDYVKRHVNRKIDQLRKKIIDEEVRPEGIEYWYRRAK